MNNLLQNSQKFLRKNGSTILSTIGGAGVIATSVMAIKATPKALRLMEEAKIEKGEELTKSEIVKVTSRVYIPTIVTGISTIACIYGANVLNKRNQAALMSAYALIDSTFKDYKDKLKDIYGEETHQRIINELAIEKTEKVNINAGYLSTECDLSLEDNDGEPKLFYDEHSNRYFEATIEQVLTAEYHLNRNYILRGFSVLNEFYEFLGLETTDYGSVLGWAPLDEGMYWIDFNHRKVVLDDGLEIYIIEMPFAPSYEYNEY